MDGKSAAAGAAVGLAVAWLGMRVMQNKQQPGKGDSGNAPPTGSAAAQAAAEAAEAEAGASFVAEAVAPFAGTEATANELQGLKLHAGDFLAILKR